MTETPPYLLPFLLEPPLPEVETVGDVDLYLPAGEGPAPAVVLVHGGPLPEQGLPVGPRAWPAYVGYGSLLAEAGLVGVMFKHSFRSGHPVAAAYAEIRERIEIARAHPRVDGDRLVVWVFSAGGVFVGNLMADREPWLRGLAGTYAYLGDPEEPGLADASEVVGTVGELPLLITRVEHEHDWVEQSVEAFVAAAGGRDLTLLDVPGAQHGFETLDHTDAARAAVRAGVVWVAERVR